MGRVWCGVLGRAGQDRSGEDEMGLCVYHTRQFKETIFLFF